MDGEFSHASTEVIDIPPAEQAEKLFRQVSARYPGLETAQGVALALICQEQNLDPRQLGNALMHEPTRVRTLTEQANNAHRGRDVYDVTFEETMGVIMVDFELARSLLSFEPVELQGLLDDFSESRKSYEGKQAYRVRVLDMIEQRNPDKEAQLLVRTIRKKAKLPSALPEHQRTKGSWIPPVIRRFIQFPRRPHL